MLLTDVIENIFCGLRQQLISAWFQFEVNRASQKHQANLTVCLHWCGQLMVLAIKASLAVAFAYVDHVVGEFHLRRRCTQTIRVRVVRLYIVRNGHADKAIFCAIRTVSRDEDI